MPDRSALLRRISRRKKSASFFVPRVEALEDRRLLALGDSLWLVQLQGLIGVTREQQLPQAQARFDAADMASRSISIADHLGFDGVLLVAVPAGTVEGELEVKLSTVEGFVAADVFNPRATNTSEIPIDVGRAFRNPPSGVPSTATFGADAGQEVFAPASINGFDGITAGQGGNWRPPDTTGAAGPSSYVQAVNNAVAIYNKTTGAAIVAPVSSFTVFNSVRIPGGTVFDPVVVYNEHTQRFGVGFADVLGTSQSRFVFAISKSSNPLSLTAADWDFFSYNTDDGTAGFQFADYPKMGYNADGFVVSFNQFLNATSYQHTAVLSIANNGASPGIVVVPGGFSHFTLAPASMHTSLPGGSFWFTEAIFGSSNTINAVRMDNVYTAAPTFTFFPLAVNQYFQTQSPHDPGGQLIGNSNLGSRMYFSGQRDVGGVNHLVAAHTSAQSSGNPYSEVRWYDINITNPGAPTLIQQGEIDPGANVDAYFPDIDIAASGSIAVGYQRSSSTEFISMYGTGREATDAAGSMQTPVLLKAGSANLNPRDRVGDYADVSVDPVDGTYWYTAQYQDNAALNPNWRTYIGHYSLAATFSVASTIPAVGSTVTVAPTQFTVDFSAPYNLATIAPSDFTVNGTPSDQPVVVVDADTVIFVYSATPAIPGLNTMAIVAGAIDSTSAIPLSAFSGQFLLDVVALAITGTSPASGSVIALGPPTQTIRVFFNEPVNPATVGPADFVINQGTVGVPTMALGNTAVDVPISGLITEGTLTLNIGANAFADTFGSPNPVGFSGNYILDYVTRAYPTPLTPKAPLGSLIYDPSVAGLINFAGDLDSFTLNIDPNQTLSIIVTPTVPGLQPRVELFDPANVSLGFAQAPAAGQITGIQTRTIATGGIHRIVVTGTGGTVGGYTVEVILNAAFELEGKVVGATNNTAATAQDINGSLLNLDTTLVHAQRGAALGTTDVSGGYSAAAVPFGFTNINGTGTPIIVGADDLAVGVGIGFNFNFYGTTYSSLFVSSNGLITFGNGNSSFSNGTLSANPAEAAIAPFWDDLYVFGASSRVLSQVIGPVGSRQLVLQWDQVNFFASTGADTLTFQAILSEGSNSIRFNYLDLSSESQTTFGASAGIKAANPTGGQFVELVNNGPPNALIGTGVSTLIAPVAGTADYYKFDAAANQSISLAVTNLSAGNVDVQLIGTDGTTILASGVAGATNLNEAIHNFLIGTAGTYFARISGDSNIPYSLVVTKAAAFDAEGNDSLAAAQSVTGTEGVLGHLGTGSASTAILSPTDSGWWDSTGFHDAFINNYFNGQFDFTQYRNYFVFNLASVAQPVSAATLRLFNPFGGFSSPDASETYGLFDVSTSLAALQATGSGQAAIHNDLGTGSSYGTVVATPASNGQILDIILNAAGIAAVNAALGGSIAFGGALTTLRAAPSQEFLFGFTSGAETRELVLTLAPSDDWYKVTLAPGETVLDVETRTPADGPGELVNNLNPKVQLFNAGGTEITPAVTILGDGRNEQFRATGLTPGASYYVKVTSQGGTTGEYFVGIQPLRTPTITVTVDDGDPGFAPARLTAATNAIGWSKVTGSGHSGDYALHADNVAESATNYARWTMTAASSVTPIEVFTSWVARPQNATNATYQVYNGAALVGTVIVNQKVSPDDVLIGSTVAESLGTFLISTGSLSVRLLTQGANGDLVADAVFDPPVALPSAAVVPAVLPAAVLSASPARRGSLLQTGANAAAVDDLFAGLSRHELSLAPAAPVLPAKAATESSSRRLRPSAVDLLFTDAGEMRKLLDQRSLQDRIDEIADALARE